MKSVIFPFYQTACSKNKIPGGHPDLMGLLTNASGWKREFKKGRSLIGKDFSRACAEWSDAIDDVPSEEFDLLYFDILDVLEKHFIEMGKKNTFKLDYQALEQLATMAMICSPDRYELLFELVKRIRFHIGDVKSFEYVHIMCACSIEFARVHFVVDTYLDSYSSMCKEVVGVCDDIDQIKGEIFANDQSVEREKNLDRLSAIIRSVFSELVDVIDREMKNMPEDRMFNIGFEWFDSSERPYMDYIDRIYMDLAECSTSDSGKSALASVKPDIDGFIRSYLDYPNKSKCE